MNNAFDVNQLKLYNREKFHDFLISIGVSFNKHLVIDTTLIQLFNCFMELKTLKDHGITGIFKLEEELSPPCVNSIRIYFLRNNLKKLQMVCKQIKQLEGKHMENLKFYLLCPFHVNAIVFTLLEEEGLYDIVTVKDLRLGFTPLDHDLISLECPEFFEETFIDHNVLLLKDICYAIKSLEKLFGSIPNVFGQGFYSEKIYNILKLIQNKEDQTKRPYIIGNLLLFDRNLDYVSVLLSQLTYAGLLDEVYNIQSETIDFNSETHKHKCEKKIIFDYKNNIFNEIKDKHFTTVPIFLRTKVRLLQNKHDKLPSMNIQEVKNLVTKELKNLQILRSSISLHIEACESITVAKGVEFNNQLLCEHNILHNIDHKNIQNFIENHILIGQSIFSSLRLLCLFSTVNDSLSQKCYESVVKLYLHSYGYENIIVLHKLEKCSLLQVQHESFKSKNKYQNHMINFKFQDICKKFNLLPTEEAKAEDLAYPVNMSYVYGGLYIPLIPRLVEKIYTSTNANFLFEFFKQYTINNKTEMFNFSFKSVQSIEALNAMDPVASHIMLVVFVGGVTYAEVSALRFLSNLLSMTIIIATTSVINGEQLMKSLAISTR